MKALNLLLLVVTTSITFGLYANNPKLQPIKEEAKKQQQIKYVIFDLGGVVYGTDGDKFSSAVGKSKFVWAGQWALRSEQKKKVKAQIKANMFEILDGVTPRKPGQIVCKDDSGEYDIPQIMCDWMQGTPCKKLMEQIHDYLDDNPDIFKNSSDRDLYTSIIDAALTPETFIDTRFFYEEAQKLAEWCLENGLELYGLTNWNGEAFEGIKKRDPEFFALFKGFVSSSQAKTMKPSPDIFKYAETEWKKTNSSFNLAQAALIDDQKENVDGARAVGAQGILVTKTDDGTPELDKIYGQLKKMCNIKTVSRKKKIEIMQDDKLEDETATIPEKKLEVPAQSSIYFKV